MGMAGWDRLARTSEQLAKPTSPLDEAIDGAFRRAIKADSVRQVNTLLSSIDRETKQFAGV